MRWRFHKLIVEIRKDKQAHEMLKNEDWYYRFSENTSLFNNFVGGYAYLSKSIVPFFFKSENPKIQIALKKHDKAVVLFWRFLFLGLIFLMLLEWVFASFNH
jgi:hypothetical protein